MRPKSLKVDWDALEEAFNDQNEELVYYLDLVTGHVLLEGEGEENSFEDDEDFDLAGGSPAIPASTALRAYVEGPDTPTKVEWLQGFLADDECETSVRDRLKAAMRSDDPAPAIRETLNENPDVRDRWYLYRSDRIRELIHAWLKQHSVEPVDAPPWDTADGSP